MDFLKGGAFAPIASTPGSETAVTECQYLVCPAQKTGTDNYRKNYKKIAKELESLPAKPLHHQTVNDFG